MRTKFSHEDIFPVIARLIRTIHQSTMAFVTHDILVTAVLNDPEGKALVDSAYQADDGEKSREWWASNMVQWFSQQITEERSEYSSQFERRKDKGAWAYKPAP